MSLVDAAVSARPTLSPFPPTNLVDAGITIAAQKTSRLVLQSMSRQSSNAVYWTIAILSLFWIAAGAALGYLLVGPDVIRNFNAATILDQPLLLLVAIVTFVPLILFWAFAVMVRRAQEMKLAAQGIAEVAARLAEPENLAQNRIMSVGQAVRREVAAMGEGIERTLARAVELETLVHTEVNQIERSYSDNEARIRSLVDGLGNEREAVVTHAERVRASITGANETLKSQLELRKRYHSRQHPRRFHKAVDDDRQFR